MCRLHSNSPNHKSSSFLHPLVCMSCFPSSHLYPVPQALSSVSVMPNELCFWIGLRSLDLRVQILSDRTHLCEHGAQLKGEDTKAWPEQKISLICSPLLQIRMIDTDLCETHPGVGDRANFEAMTSSLIEFERLTKVQGSVTAGNFPIPFLNRTYSWASSVRRSIDNGTDFQSLSYALS